MYKSKEMPVKLEISLSMLQRWDREQTLITKRNPKGCCFNTENQYLNDISQSNHHHRKVVALNDSKTSPQQEWVDDLISMIYVFSCRIDGLRKYKKIQEDDRLC